MTTDRLDRLIDRLIDFDFAATDIDELAQLVRDGEDCAERLDGALADERLLRTGMRAAQHRAEKVHTKQPEHVAAHYQRPHPSAPSTPLSPTGPQRAGRWAGKWGRTLAFAGSWTLTAASLAFAASIAIRQPAPAEPVTNLAAGAQGVESRQRTNTPSGRQVLGALPPVAVGLHQKPDGNIGLVYIRAQVEQADLADLFRVAKDEHGRPVPIPTRALTAADRRSM